MSRETKQVFRYWLIAVLAVGVLRLLSACTPIVPVVELEPMLPCTPFGMCMIGQVTCSADNQPVVILRKGISEEEKPFTLTHEYTHVSQMRKDCKETQQRYQTDSDFRWAMELQAYCAEAGARIKAGRSIKEVVERLTSILIFLYNATEEDVYCDWMKPP